MRGVIVNCPPKMGNHLLQRIVCLMGWQNAKKTHFVEQAEKTYGRGNPVIKSIKWKWQEEPFGPAFNDLPDDIVAVIHSPASIGAGSHPMITSKRHPRNALISMTRWKAGQKTAVFPTHPVAADICSEIYHHDFVGMLRQFLPLLDGSHLIMRFEDIVGPEQYLSVKKIARYLHADCDVSAVIWNIPGYTITRTGSLSRWEDEWTTEVDNLWQDRGGREIERAYGYGT